MGHDGFHVACAPPKKRKKKGRGRGRRRKRRKKEGREEVFVDIFFDLPNPPPALLGSSNATHNSLRKKTRNLKFDYFCVFCVFLAFQRSPDRAGTLRNGRDACVDARPRRRPFLPRLWPLPALPRPPSRVGMCVVVQCGHLPRSLVAGCTHWVRDHVLAPCARPPTHAGACLVAHAACTSQ